MNYPFPIYHWDCTGEDKSKSEEEENTGPLVIDDPDSWTRRTIPDDLSNQYNWFWTWVMLMSYICSGGAWLLGGFIFNPYQWTNSLYHFVYLLYGAQVWLVQDRLSAESFIVYPVRRLIV